MLLCGGILGLVFERLSRYGPRVFDGTHADTLTRVDLHGDGGFIGWEISCLGKDKIGRASGRERV